jgi:hypothetical protein
MEIAFGASEGALRLQGKYFRITNCPGSCKYFEKRPFEACDDVLVGLVQKLALLKFVPVEGEFLYQLEDEFVLLCEVLLVARYCLYSHLIILLFFLHQRGQYILELEFAPKGIFLARVHGMRVSNFFH